jgi:hypothetical protein
LNSKVAKCEKIDLRKNLSSKFNMGINKTNFIMISKPFDKLGGGGGVPVKNVPTKNFCPNE